MKTKNLTILAIAVICFLQIVKAQKNDSLILRPFGMGVNVEHYIIGDIISQDIDYPAYTDNIIFTFNIENVFRIEPEIGFSTIKDTMGSSQGGASTTNTVMKYGITFAYLFQKGNVNFSPGIHLQASDFKLTERYNGGFPSTSTTTISTVSLGPELGAEYYITKHFSFGANISFLYTSSTLKNANSGYPETLTAFNTSTGLVVRFFF